jgi:PKD repeat protein
MRIATLKANPKIAEAVIKRDAQLEAFTKKYVEDFYNKRTPTATYTIPLVFHVIHNFGNENISRAQILDGINILNQTFRKQRPDTASIVAAFKPIHADCDIEFRLATIDPDGNCTSGINRISSPLTTIGDHSVKSLIQWPPDKYLNVYVVANAAGLAGHCVWPADADSIPSWDGIVISHNYVGSIGTSNYTQSVAFAHECGHYLNLQHIWGGNNVPGFYFYPCADTAKDCNIDDLVADTPPTIGWQSCNLNGASCGNAVDNVQNAMDYSYCNKMFTYGQKARMHACLNDTIAGRNNLWQTANLIATGTYDIPGPLCQADFTSNKTVVCETGGNQITFTNTSFNGNISSLQWSFPGGSPSGSTVSSPVVTYSTAGSYPVTLKVFSGTDSAETTRNNMISVLPNTGNAFPFSESFESTSSLNGPLWFSNSFDTVNSWQLSTDAAFTGSHSVMLNNFNNSMMTKDELYSPVIDLSASPNISFTFKYAFARKDTISQDQLQVYITKTCTGAYVPRISLIGSALETVAPQNTPFIPASGLDWRQVSVNVPALYCTANFRFKFIFTSKGGNNIYIDDINIDTSTGLEELSENVSGLSLYPNPASEELNVSFDLNTTKSMNIIITNVLGQNVQESGMSIFNKGQNKLSLDLRQLKSGVYFVKFSDGKQEITRKCIIQK